MIQIISFQASVATQFDILNASASADTGFTIEHDLIKSGNNQMASDPVTSPIKWTEDRQCSMNSKSFDLKIDLEKTGISTSVLSLKNGGASNDCKVSERASVNKDERVRALNMASMTEFDPKLFQSMENLGIIDCLQTYNISETSERRDYNLEDNRDELHETTVSITEPHRLKCIDGIGTASGKLRVMDSKLSGVKESNLIEDNQNQQKSCSVETKISGSMLTESDKKTTAERKKKKRKRNKNKNCSPDEFSLKQTEAGTSEEELVE